MTYAISHSIPATFAAYILLRIILFIYRKALKRPHSPMNIALMGVVTTVIATVIAGYGMAEVKSNPVFSMAFFHYFGPVMAATVIELVRIDIEGKKSAQKTTSSGNDSNGSGDQ